MDKVPDSSATGVQVAGGAAAPPAVDAKRISFALLWRGDRGARDAFYMPAAARYLTRCALRRR
jgi:hypothetical protein